MEEIGRDRTGDRERSGPVDEVPDVKDDEISECIYSIHRMPSDYDFIVKINFDRDMQLELYKIIAAKLNKRSTGEDGVVLNFLKDSCAKSVDFEFVPVEHIFLHFLISYGFDRSGEGYHEQVEDMTLEFLKKFMEDIVAECKRWDEKNNTTETRMQMTLFSILDPRGRTIVHTLFHMLLTARATDKGYDLLCSRRIVEIFRGLASATPWESWPCYTAKDGAGRTLYHMASIYGLSLDNMVSAGLFGPDKIKPDQYPDVNVEVTPLCCKEFRALQVWSFEERSIGWMDGFHQIPIYLAILFNSTKYMNKLLKAHAEEGFLENTNRYCIPFYMASLHGRIKMVEQFLKHQVQFKNIQDGGFDGCNNYHQALHCAAASGHVEVVQMILKYPIYDPMCQDGYAGDTALHSVVGMGSYYMEF